MVEKTPFQPVEDWLRSLGLLHYAQSFYDNGYEDIDTCKLIKNADLDVINVKSERDRNDILSAVAKLNQNLYFELEQDPPEIERVKLEKVLLKSKLKECLNLHNIQLIEPPYFNPDGTLGDLYTLAIRLADELETFFEDVLEALEILRKRQLPVQSYNQINEIPDPVVQKDAMSVHDPAEYLDVETHKKSRTLSTSKYDTRITKSTTDLNFDIHQNSSTKLKGKSQKQRSFINIFKRHKDDMNKKIEQRKSTFEFNATDITLSQNEIKNLFEKVKTKQITQEDALATVQNRGLSKSLSGEGNEHIIIDSSPPSETGSLNKIKKGKISKSMIRKPSSLFYTDDNVANNELLAVKLQDRRASVAGDMVCSAKNSPDLTRHGILKIIRGSIRKKSKSSDGSSFDKDEQLSPSEEADLTCNDFIDKDEVSQPQYVDLKIVQPISEQGKKESRSAPPPPPPRLDLKLNQYKDRSESNISCPAVFFTENVDDHNKNEKFQKDPPHRESHSLKIKSPKYQDDISKQKPVENKENLVLINKVENRSLKSKAENTCLKNHDDLTLDILKPAAAPRRPERRIAPSESVPVAPPRRQRVITSPISEEKMPVSEEKNFDDIGKEMSRLIDDLNDDLTYLDNGSTSTQSGNNSNNNSPSSDSPDSKIAFSYCRDSKIINSSNPNSVTFNTNNRNLNNIKITNEETNKEEEIKAIQKPIVLPKRFTSIRNSVITSDSTDLTRRSNAQSSNETFNSLKTLDDAKNNETVVKNTEKIVEQKKLRTSLNQILEKKLRKEEIKLNEYPYTGSDGSWIVPFALVKRYSEELQHSVEDIAALFDVIRTEKRASKKLPVIPLDIKRLRSNASISKKISLQEWLIHIGLPMFTSDLADAGIDSVSEVSQMSIEDLKQVSVCDERHMLLLIKEAKNI